MNLNSFTMVALMLALFAIGAFLFHRIPQLRSRAQAFARRFRLLKASPFFIACALVFIAGLAVLLVLVPTKVAAQPAGTNTAGYGAHQFNDGLIAPLTPSRTLAEQIARGINSGTSITTTDGTVTNSFSTNYTYSAAPAVVVTDRGTGISVTNEVVSVTTTNFIWKAGAPSITNSWIAIGQ